MIARAAALGILKRSSVVLSLLALASAANAIERAGDATDADELRAVASVAGEMQRSLLMRCEHASGEAQLELYRRHNDSAGTWNAIVSVASRLELAMESASPIDEQRIRADLRDEARFALWEIDEHVARLTNALFHGGPIDERQTRDEIRTVRQARVVVERLSANR
jgi:hypothetical protein